MLKLFLALLCALALAAPPAARAEEAVEGMPAEAALAANESVLLDLDGDGAEETVLPRWTDLGDERSLELSVMAADGAHCSYTVHLEALLGVYALDVDGDGALELLITGDEMSDDYSTWCLRYGGGALTPVQFADANRSSSDGGYFDYGYGKIVAVDGGALTLAGSQDVLGTWMASRVFTLRDGRFELDDGGLWRMEDHSGDADYWAYRSLDPVREVEVTFDGGEAGTIQPGEKMLVTASDRLSVAHFITQDGRSGSFPIEPNEADGWGFLVGGLPDYEVFDYLPYAD